MQADKRRRLMLKYVLISNPSDVDSFVLNEDPRVVRAMKATVRNLVGSLPRSFFEVKVSCVADSLAQLMMTLLMTGYVFHAGKQRMDMKAALMSLPSTSSSDDEEYAAGVQKKDVSGQVLRWNHRNGIESMSAITYIEQLEQEVTRLKTELGRQTTLASSSPSSIGGLALQLREDGGGKQAIAGWSLQGGNQKSFLPSVSSSAAEAAAAVGAAIAGGGELMEYISGMDNDNGPTASPEVIEAMTAFVERMMGTSEPRQLQSMQSEFDTYELSKVFIWLLVVGYALRTAESKLDHLDGWQDDEGDGNPALGRISGGGNDGGKGGKGGWDWGSLWSKLLPGGGKS